MPNEGGNNRSLDQADRRIVELLLTDGRLSVTELAARVGLSKTPCQTRLKRLIDDGVIHGFCAVVSPDVLERAHVAFVEVVMSDTRERALEGFNKTIRGIPEIEECHMIAGSFDYLLKVRSRDIQDYRRILGEVISELPHVSKTSTHVAMERVKDQTDLVRSGS